MAAYLGQLSDWVISFGTTYIILNFCQHVVVLTFLKVIYPLSAGKKYILISVEVYSCILYIITNAISYKQ